MVGCCGRWHKGGAGFTESYGMGGIVSAPSRAAPFTGSGRFRRSGADPPRSGRVSRRRAVAAPAFDGHTGRSLRFGSPKKPGCRVPATPSKTARIGPPTHSKGVGRLPGPSPAFAAPYPRSAHCVAVAGHLAAVRCFRAGIQGARRIAARTHSGRGGTVPHSVAARSAPGWQPGAACQGFRPLVAVAFGRFLLRGIAPRPSPHIY